MKRREIERKFDEIVAFAETCTERSRSIEHFRDTPVKRYSSGIYVRLAFAVAAHHSTSSRQRLEPEILLVDEVLAVGDGCISGWGHSRQRIRPQSERIVMQANPLHQPARIT